MDDQQLFDELLQAARQLKVEVRIELFETPATSGGGLCILRGETLVLLDQHATLPDRLSGLARALADLEHETVYMAPEARELIEGIPSHKNRAVEERSTAYLGNPRLGVEGENQRGIPACVRREARSTDDPAESVTDTEAGK